jgi:hypothetical protein
MGVILEARKTPETDRPIVSRTAYGHNASLNNSIDLVNSTQQR